MITLSPQEITALLLEVEKNDTPTDVLLSAKQKLVSDYKRQTGDVPSLEIFADIEDRQELSDLTPHQQTLIDGYYALDPGTRCIGYFRGQPVIHSYTSPMRMRSGSTRRNLVVVSRDGGAKSLPRVGWADNFIPAEGVKWAEAETIISDWHLYNAERLSGV